MKENMIQKTIWVHNDKYSLIWKRADDSGRGVGEYLRSLLERYVSGSLDIEGKEGIDRKQTSFYAPPDLLEIAESKGLSQGYKFGVLMNKLMDRDLGQTPIGDME